MYKQRWIQPDQRAENVAYLHLLLTILSLILFATLGTYEDTQAYICNNHQKNKNLAMLKRVSNKQENIFFSLTVTWQQEGLKNQELQIQFHQRKACPKHKSKTSFWNKSTKSSKNSYFNNKRSPDIYAYLSMICFRDNLDIFLKNWSPTKNN